MSAQNPSPAKPGLHTPGGLTEYKCWKSTDDASKGEGPANPRGWIASRCEACCCGHVPRGSWLKSVISLGCYWKVVDPSKKRFSYWECALKEILIPSCPPPVSQMPTVFHALIALMLCLLTGWKWHGQVKTWSCESKSILSQIFFSWQQQTD